MSHEDTHELDAQIREIFAAAEVGPHPPAEELSAYVRGELLEAEAEGLQSHLGSCPECTAAVLALGSADSGLDADHLDDDEVAAGVEAIVSGVGVSGVDVSGVGDSRLPTAPRSWVGTALAVAAVLAIVSLSLALWFAWQQVGQLEDALQQARVVPETPVELTPQTGVPIVDLYPSSVARGEPQEPRAISLAPDASMVALILTPPSGPTHDVYILRMANADNVELWRGPARPGEAGTFVVMLPRGHVEAGVRRIELYAVEGSSERLLETYRLRFEL